MRLQRLRILRCACEAITSTRDQKEAQRGSKVWQVFPYEGSSSCTLKDWEEVSSEEKLKGWKGKR